MKQNPARTRFKRQFGQANHYLVTALVSLHNLDSSQVFNAPEELRASWNPKDRSASIRRTRLFVLQSILGSAADGIDMYISLLYRKPDYIRSAELSSQLDAAKRSVLKKVQAVAHHYSVDPSVSALLDILITWRNNVVHELAENTVTAETRKTLHNNKAEIASKYRGLDIEGLPDKAERGESLTFKETASLINAAHHYVEEVDGAVISKLDMDELCANLVQDALDNRTESESFRAKFFSLGSAKRGRFIKNWLASEFGIVNIDETIIGRCTGLKPNAGKS